LQLEDTPSCNRQATNVATENQQTTQLQSLVATNIEQTSVEQQFFASDPPRTPAPAVAIGDGNIGSAPPATTISKDLGEEHRGDSRCGSDGGAMDLVLEDQRKEESTGEGGAAAEDREAR
jgi:hypothetical protein